MLKNPQNQYMSHKKHGVHLGLSRPFDLVCLQYSSSICKTHSPSARDSSPTTGTAHPTLGLKSPTLHPRYTIYYTHLYLLTNLIIDQASTTNMCTSIYNTFSEDHYGKAM